MGSNANKMVFFASPPGVAVTGTINICMTLIILALLLAVIYKRVRSQTIIHITLLIDIIFCVSIMLSTSQSLGEESERRQALREAADAAVAAALSDLA